MELRRRPGAEEQEEQHLLDMSDLPVRSSIVARSMRRSFGVPPTRAADCPRPSQCARTRSAGAHPCGRLRETRIPLPSCMHVPSDLEAAVPHPRNRLLVEVRVIHGAARAQRRLGALAPPSNRRNGAMPGIPTQGGTHSARGVHFQPQPRGRPAPRGPTAYLSPHPQLRPGLIRSA